jgi:hypothetical protein
LSILHTYRVKYTSTPFILFSFFLHLHFFGSFSSPLFATRIFFLHFFMLKQQRRLNTYFFFSSLIFSTSLIYSFSCSCLRLSFSFRSTSLSIGVEKISGFNIKNNIEMISKVAFLLGLFAVTYAQKVRILWIVSCVCQSRFIDQWNKRNKTRVWWPLKREMLWWGAAKKQIIIALKWN